MNIKGLLKGIYILSAIGAVGCAGASLYYEHQMRKARRMAIRKKAESKVAADTEDVVERDKLYTEIEDLERDIKKYNKKNDDPMFISMTCVAVGALALVGLTGIRCNELATRSSVRLELLDKQYQLSAKYIPENKWMKFNGDILKLSDTMGKGAAAGFNPKSHPDVLMEGFTLRRSLYA